MSKHYLTLVYSDLYPTFASPIPDLCFEFFLVIMVKDSFVGENLNYRSSPGRVSKAIVFDKFFPVVAISRWYCLREWVPDRRAYCSCSRVYSGGPMIVAGF